MAKGTDFGGVHSSRTLNLIQQKVDIQPAQPKLNLIDVPGADGSKDLSDRPAGRIVFHDRTLTWTFALYPGENWHDKHSQVSAALNGKRCKITLDDDPNVYYDGRLAVKKYNTDKSLRQITVEATCSPYKFKQQETRVETSLTTSYKSIALPNWSKPVIPEITVPSETTIRWKGATATLAAGTHRLLDVELQAGANTLEAKLASGSGTMVIVYREGSL